MLIDKWWAVIFAIPQNTIEQRAVLVGIWICRERRLRAARSSGNGSYNVVVGKMVFAVFLFRRKVRQSNLRADIILADNGIVAGVAKDDKPVWCVRVQPYA